MHGCGAEEPQCSQGHGPLSQGAEGAPPQTLLCLPSSAPISCMRERPPHCPTKPPAQARSAQEPHLHFTFD